MSSHLLFLESREGEAGAVVRVAAFLDHRDLSLLRAAFAAGGTEDALRFAQTLFARLPVSHKANCSLDRSAK